MFSVDRLSKEQLLRDKEALARENAALREQIQRERGHFQERLRSVEQIQGRHAEALSYFR